VSLFLESYQQASSHGQGKDLPGPLNEQELAWMAELIQASNLFLVSWTVSYYFANEPNPEEYLRYLRHGVRVMKWLDTYQTELKKLIMRQRIDD
jgi:hypothetical protein